MKKEDFIRTAWSGETLEALSAFVRIPSKSTAFDPHWEKNGFLTQALEEAALWGRKLFPSATFEICRKPGIPPALFVEIPATLGHDGDPAFFYGHFDKQPETEGWSDGLGPWTPVVKDGRLYGRGAADDGYSFYMALTAVKSLECAGIAHARIVGLFETNEESGSYGLKDFLLELQSRFGRPAFLGILDLSLCDYNRVWLTQSLRGVVSFRLTVEVLESPVHSGSASGIVPSSFAVMRALLDRLEDPLTGRVKLSAFHTQMPERHHKTLEQSAKLRGEAVWKSFPWKDATEPRSRDPREAIVLNTWEPTLSVLGADGLPSSAQASALIRPSTSLLLSFRIPPYVDAKTALAQAEEVLMHDIPCSATVTIDDKRAESGFDVPALAPWLEAALDEASIKYFGNPCERIFEGATIGTMKDFGEIFPGSPFFNTGVLGTKEHAHAPDESIDLAYAEQLTKVIADVIEKIPRSKK